MVDAQGFAWLKGHGTQNDFIVLPDPDGTVHPDLDPAFVTALCNRRSGIGADGILRVVRSAALDESAQHAAEGAEWFMDYRNADGSVGEMCGNGIRVFALYLAQQRLTEPAADPGRVRVGTRAGAKTVTYRADGSIAVDMGTPRLLGESKIVVGDRSWAARHVATGNPHAVVFVSDLAEAGTLLDAPGYDEAVYPNGVNVEFVVQHGPAHIAMRVHERGSGETRSCGTGACAAAVATAAATGSARDLPYRVDVPGGCLTVTWRADDHVELAGPAQVVARGRMEWLGAA